MNKNDISAWLALAGLGLGLSGPASAHLEYYDLNKGYQIKDRSDRTPGDSRTAIPTLDTAHDEKVEGGGIWQITEATATTPRTVSVTVNGVKRFSWIAGTNPSLGDSHAVQFFNFRLDQPSFVSITWTQVGSGLDPAFTLYRGLLVYYGHDDAVSDPLNPQDDSFKPVQNTKDTGSIADIQGIVSPFRDTVSPESSANNFNFYQGQFNALNGWSQGRQDGDWWSAVEYLAHRNDNSGPSESLLNQQLPAGDYTIAAGGAACNDNATSATCRNPSLTATLTFSASAVQLAANTPPAFVDGSDTLTVAKDSPAVDISANLHVTDPDPGQTITWTQAVAPAHGSLGFTGTTAATGGVHIVPGGAITYTPASGYTGTDSFAIQASDGTASAARPFTVTVGTQDPGFDPSIATTQEVVVGEKLKLPILLNTTLGKATIKAKQLPKGARLSLTRKKGSNQWVANLTWKPKPSQLDTSRVTTFTAKVKPAKGKAIEATPLTVTFKAISANEAQSGTHDHSAHQ